MTEYIRDRGLLPCETIDEIVTNAPAQLVSFQEAAARVDLDRRATMRDWLERFHAGALRDPA